MRDTKISYNKDFEWKSNAGQSKVTIDPDSLLGTPIISDTADITTQGKELGKSLEYNFLDPAYKAGAKPVNRLIVIDKNGGVRETDLKIYELDTVTKDLKNNGQISNAHNYKAFLNVLKTTMDTPELIKTQTDLSEETLPTAIKNLEKQDAMFITATLTNESTNLTMYLFEVGRNKIQAYDKNANQLEQEQFEGFPTNRFLNPTVFQRSQQSSVNAS